jgi:RNA polymerase sigma-70 factor, ECF subfamily
MSPVDDKPTTDGPAEDAVVTAATNGDERAFAVLVDRHRRELHVHCYRMLGSFEEAEDRVQETFLRAWRSRHSFAGRSTYRAWLYRIATNACLEKLRRFPRPAVATDGSGRLPAYSSFPWLQPYPDELLAEQPAIDAAPDALAVARETIELAYLAAIQLLPPRQRAVLILREVLDFPAADTAALLDTTVQSVNSSLQRARATLQNFQHAERAETRRATNDMERELVAKYMHAHEHADPAAVVALLRDDARLTISPMGMCWDGRDAITPDFIEGMNALGEFRCVELRANHQPAVANYLRRWGETDYRAFTIVVLGIDDHGALVEMTTFASPALFAAFGIPDTVT